MVRPDNVNKVPVGSPSRTGEERKVFIVYSPTQVTHMYRVAQAFQGPLGIVAGLAERLIAGKPLVEALASHWAVVVGEYAHELEKLDHGNDNIRYVNDKVQPPGDHMEHIGYTKFNDSAIVEEGALAINKMGSQYKPIGNNCQNFVINLIVGIRTYSAPGGQAAAGGNEPADKARNIMNQQR